ncbi:MAG: WecB/TagA/CpsF family glycosyltransferase [Fibrobacterota bacterium]|nr:MAG: WecB/TagA/CpsF family glycosyltransferase [Fibrobacterota bacterium]
MSLRRFSVMGARVDAGSMQEMDAEILRLSQAKGCSRVCFANAHMVVESWRDPSLRTAMEEADIVCPDGMPIARLLRRHFPGQMRVEGMAAFPRLLEAASRQGIAVGFFGSTPAVQEAMREKAARELPNLRVVLSEAPPFGEFDEAQRARQLDKVRQSGAKLVFVGLGCPRQELWMAAARDLDACLLGVGNAFEVWLGHRRRAPAWAREACLEWAFRLVQEPRRLAGRYARSNLLFLLALPGWLWTTRRISNWRES